MEDGLKRNLQEQCDHIQKLLTGAGYKTVKVEPIDIGRRLGVVVMIDNADAKADTSCKT